MKLLAVHGCLSQRGLQHNRGFWEEISIPAEQPNPMLQLHSEVHGTRMAATKSGATGQLPKSLALCGALWLAVGLTPVPTL